MLECIALVTSHYFRNSVFGFVGDNCQIIDVHETQYNGRDQKPNTSFPIKSRSLCSFGYLNNVTEITTVSQKI